MRFLLWAYRLDSAALKNILWRLRHNTGRTGDARANRHHDWVESMTRDAARRR
jgi:hypothetical protein